MNTTDTTLNDNLTASDVRDNLAASDVRAVILSTIKIKNGMTNEAEAAIVERKIDRALRALNRGYVASAGVMADDANYAAIFFSTAR